MVIRERIRKILGLGRKQSREGFILAREHALRAAGKDPELRKRVERIFDVFERGNWKNVEMEEVEQLLMRHVNNTDVERLNRALRFAKIHKDPRATLGEIMIFMQVLSDEQAERVSKMLDSASGTYNRKKLALKMFAHQRVSKIPYVGFNDVIETAARHALDKEPKESLDEILKNTAWRRRVLAIETRRQRREEGFERELREKGATTEQIRQIEEFLEMQEEEKGKAPLGKRSLKWSRK